LAPADRVNEVIDLLPARCRHCDCRLTGGSRRYRRRANRGGIR
jgi:hypothetical protein